MKARAESPVSAWWFVPVCTALLALRKPWALHTPQLWAEDGSIFLTQDEQMGIRAWWEPYNGYLHLLPRLIAWFASHTADPAWWPAIYNGCAFAITVGLFARLASGRVDLPAKPWLMLALVLVVGTGEVLINVTNLQWVTAFFLVLQLFTTRRPHPAVDSTRLPPLPSEEGERRREQGNTVISGSIGESSQPCTIRGKGDARSVRSALQRAGDLVILVLAGLNGPFAIVFLPLFAWRAWRQKNVDTTAALLAVGGCAMVQGWLLLRSGSGMNLVPANEPIEWTRFAAVIGSRLVTWPFLGPAAVRHLPSWTHAIAGAVVIVPLLWWALRRDARRAWRAPIVAAFCLITLASVYRVRADTWTHDNLINGDRYFYIPRVLFAWLLVWEFDARPKAVAWLARGLGLLAVALHAPHYVLPAPRDYRWAEHCDPIRRGVPANIYTLPEGWWIEYPGRQDKS